MDLDPIEAFPWQLPSEDAPQQSFVVVTRAHAAAGPVVGGRSVDLGLQQTDTNDSLLMHDPMGGNIMTANAAAEPVVGAGGSLDSGLQHTSTNASVQMQDPIQSGMMEQTGQQGGELSTHEMLQNWMLGGGLFF